MSVVNKTSIEVTCKLLSKHDYLKVVEQLQSHHDDLDIEAILDFMLCLICDGHLLNLHGMFMFKKKLVMPRTLFLTGMIVILLASLALFSKGELHHCCFKQNAP
jgi:hypothetical protein